MSKLATKKMDGHNVFLAVVDTGVNIAHLRSKGRTPKLDVANSWVPSGVSTAPGAHPVDHGTMCAYDAGIAAPKAKYPVSKLSPLQLRSLIFKTAEDKASTGFDFDYGWGILDPRALLAALP